MGSRATVWKGHLLEPVWPVHLHLMTLRKPLAYLPTYLPIYLLIYLFSPPFTTGKQARVSLCGN